MGQNQASSHNSLFTIIGEENGKTIVKVGGKLYHLKILTYSDQKASLQKQKQLKNNQQLINNHLISLVYFEAKTDITLCSTFHKINLLFDYMPHTLASEISSRRSQHKQFTDKQLWSIICSCTLAFSYLQRNNVELECFSLQDIMLSDQGHIKLNNPLNYADTCSSTFFDASYFYSPEQILGEHYTKSISGVYQLGLALLNCIDLDLNIPFYTRDGLIDNNIVSDKLNNASKLVNKDIKNILHIMLEKDQNRRPHWISLQKIILTIIQSHKTPSVKTLHENSPEKMKTNSHNKINLGIPCIPLKVDTSDQASFWCYQSETDEEKIDDTNTDMMENSRFEQESVLKESNKQNNIVHFEEKNQQKVKNVTYEIVDQQLEGGRYEGQTLNGMRDGFGTFHYPQGGIYIGQWRTNKMQGQGCMYYPSGKIAYEGHWKNDKLDGFGVLYNEDVIKLKQSYDYRSFDHLGDCWVKYEGQFKNDNKQGKGKLVLSNGEWFKGEFLEDKIDGYGEFFRKDGTKLIGNWRRNVLV